MSRTTYDQRMFRATFEAEFTYLNGFTRNTHRYARQPALIDPLENEIVTYADLDARTNRLARALAADGVSTGDVVMVQLFNGIPFVELYLAPKKLGAISCPINYRLAYGETATILDDSCPAVFVYDASLAATAEQALAAARHKPRRVVVVGESQDRTEYGEFVAPHDDRDLGIEHPSSVYDETTRLYTVSKLGEPKGVPLNNLNEILSAHDVIMHFPLTSLDRTLNMTPWFHRGGLYSGGPNPVLYVGAASIVMRRFDAGQTLDWVARHGLTYLIGTPTNLEMLADAQERRPRDLSSLKGIVTMGAPLERDACRRYQEVLTPNIYNGYGTTEAFWNTFLRPYDLPEHAGSAGRSCTDDDVRVVKIYPDRRAEPDDLASRGTGEVGEVIVRAPGKTTYTYINKPEQAAETFYKGWVYAGDLATWDEDEFVTIVARKNDMIISGGENIHPRQIENVLCEHPDVVDAVVVPAIDRRWGEVVTAYVVPRRASLTAADLNRHCVQHPMLARYKRPRYYRFVGSIPQLNGEKNRRLITEWATRDLAAGLMQHP